MDPSSTNEFSHGAFRFMHAIVPGSISLVNVAGVEISKRVLSDMNSSVVNILETNYLDLLRGMLVKPMNVDGYNAQVSSLKLI